MGREYDGFYKQFDFFRDKMEALVNRSEVAVKHYVSINIDELARRITLNQNEIEKYKPERQVPDDFRANALKRIEILNNVDNSESV